MCQVLERSSAIIQPKITTNKSVWYSLHLNRLLCCLLATLHDGRICCRTDRLLHSERSYGTSQKGLQMPQGQGKCCQVGS